MAVTIATGWPRTNVVGNMRQILYKLTVGVTGDTQNINGVGHITGVATTSNSGITAVTGTDRSGTTPAYLTFTGTGTVHVEVWGY